VMGLALNCALGTLVKSHNLVVLSPMFS
jgi:hypothetical protein